MQESDASKLVKSQGFLPLGALTNRLAITLWWNPHTRTELLMIALGHTTLIKGTKGYHMVAMDDTARTWMRDIGALHDWLQGHFSDLHISFSWFRDLPDYLADEHLNKICIADEHTEHLARLQHELIETKQTKLSAQNLYAEFQAIDPALAAHFRADTGRCVARESKLSEAIQNETESSNQREQLIHKYLAKGSAARLTFSVASNIHTVHTSAALNEGIDQIQRELGDIDRYQIRQKLSGGKLKIRVQPAEQPEIHWIERWFGGSLDPRQLGDLDMAVKQQLVSSLSVYPTQDIQVGSTVIESSAKVGARTVGALIDRIDGPGDRTTGTNQPNTDHDIVLNLGLISETQQRAVLDLNRFDHAILSGATGSGKSWAARTIVEQALKHKEMNLLVLDPRNQWAGLADPALGRQVEYYAPGLSNAAGLPADLSSLANSCTIISFKWMTPSERCITASKVLSGIFLERAQSQAPRINQLVVLEEAHLFTRQGIGDSSAKDFEIILERVFREGRKFGICVLLVTQSVRDLTRNLASIRQNAGTKIFLRNTDREIEVARDSLDDPRAITRLKRGEALISTPDRKPLRVQFDQPRTRIWDEGSEESLQRVNGEIEHPIGTEAIALLRIINSMDTAPLPSLSAVGRESGITSRRKLLVLIGKLEHAGCIRSRRLRVRGQPRIIEITEAGTRTLSGQPVQESGQKEEHKCS